MGHESGLLPDFTFFIQLGIFIASYVVLQVLVFRPYLSLLRAREEMTTGLKERAIRNRELSDKLRLDYETFMRSERKKLLDWNDNEKRKVLDDEKKIIQAARDQVGSDLQNLREQIQLEAEKVRGDLLPLISDYSSSIASKLLGRTVRVPLSAVSRDKIGEAEQGV
jgi:F0F1-type ATP synthase membrane subunit b/b'